MSASTDEEALSNLRSDSLFQRLDRFVPAFRVFRALGIERSETLHSRLIANLLNPDQLREAETMMRSVLRNLLDRELLTGEAATLVHKVIAESWIDVSVETEFQFIDIVVQITTSERRIAIGIENKIDASEGREQLRRYQTVLEDTFPGQTAILLFLTPTGREQTTALLESAVPTVSVGYDVLLDCIEETKSSADLGSSDRQALVMIADHIREDILGTETEEVKPLVRELWKAHGKALRLAMEYRPRLEDIQDRYKALIHDRFGDDAEHGYWRYRGELREIHMSLNSWRDSGLPFTFMLYVTDGRPAVRLLVSNNHYNIHSENLQRWAQETNASSPALIDTEFKKLPGWHYWRRVLNEPGYPPEAILNEGAFDDATAREAVGAVVELYETLLPYVETA